MNYYDPDEMEDRIERMMLRRRADRAARTVEEQQRWEDDEPVRFQRLCDRLYAEGVRGWMPRLTPGMSLSQWALDVKVAEVSRRNGGGWVDRRSEMFATRSYLDACDSMEKAR